jgi:predicted 3-demethylubiquinone-9 3-methyltransferase (glyoxalase superfamily)
MLNRAVRCTAAAVRCTPLAARLSISVDVNRPYIRPVRAGHDDLSGSMKEAAMTHSITPFLWFNDNAEEATQFYVSVFKDSEILGVNRMGDQGQVVTTSFRLNGQQFTALNGGPHFSFTEAVSFVIDCVTQEDVDYYWNALTEGGEESQCGWLKDKYGLSWQVVPRILLELLQDDDPEKANRVMQAMLQMQKIDIATLEAAYAQA